MDAVHDKGRRAAFILKMTGRRLTEIHRMSRLIKELEENLMNAPAASRPNRQFNSILKMRFFVARVRNH